MVPIAQAIIKLNAVDRPKLLELLAGRLDILAVVDDTCTTCNKTMKLLSVLAAAPMKEDTAKLLLATSGFSVSDVSAIVESAKAEHVRVGADTATKIAAVAQNQTVTLIQPEDVVAAISGTTTGRLTIVKNASGYHIVSSANAELEKHESHKVITPETTLRPILTASLKLLSTPSEVDPSLTVTTTINDVPTDIPLGKFLLLASTTNAFSAWFKAFYPGDYEEFTKRYYQCGSLLGHGVNAWTTTFFSELDKEKLLDIVGKLNSAIVSSTVDVEQRIRELESRQRKTLSMLQKVLNKLETL